MKVKRRGWMGGLETVVIFSSVFRDGQYKNRCMLAGKVPWRTANARVQMQVSNPRVGMREDYSGRGVGF